MEPMPDTAQVIKKVSHKPRVKSNATVPLKKHSNEMTSNRILLYSQIRISQPLSEKLPPEMDGNKYTTPQMGNL